LILHSPNNRQESEDNELTEGLCNAAAQRKHCIDHERHKQHRATTKEVCHVTAQHASYHHTCHSTIIHKSSQVKSYRPSASTAKPLMHCIHQYLATRKVFKAALNLSLEKVRSPIPECRARNCTSDSMFYPLTLCALQIVFMIIMIMKQGRPDGQRHWGDITEPVEADVRWRIENAVDWQLEGLERNSSTGTAAPYAGQGKQWQSQSNEESHFRMNADNMQSLHTILKHQLIATHMQHQHTSSYVIWNYTSVWRPFWHKYVQFNE